MSKSMPPQSILTNTLMALREVGAYGLLEDYGLIEIYGQDSERFLQSQTTNDVKQLTECTSQLSCILDRKAHVLAPFSLYRKHDSYRIIAEKTLIEPIIEHLEKFRFADKVEIINLSKEGVFVAIQGPKAKEALLDGLYAKAQPALLDRCLSDQHLWGCACHAFKFALCGEPGYMIWYSRTDVETALLQIEDTCSQIGMVNLTPELQQTARIEAGMPVFGVDFDANDFLPETGLDEAVVSYTKGCFLGQEVLARVRSQGSPTRGLTGFLFSKGHHWTFPVDTKATVDGAEIGTLKSNCYSPTLDTTIALVSLKRDYRVPGKVLTISIEGQEYEVTVKVPPFVKAESAPERAHRFYELALKEFAHEIEDAENPKSVLLLREAIELDPELQDAYETLGVILSKHGKLDEAIELMKQLAAMNPDSVMAHTNLSVFYVDKGMKDEAEEEKAISMSIRMKLAAQQVSTQQKEQEEKAQRRLEAEDRMDMFKQVLELDDDDLLANYGVGSCYVALDQFEEAVPFLQKAIVLKPSYTVAYLSLAEAFEGLGDTDKAVHTYQQGIEVAAKRGDMSPMNEMQKHLDRIKSQKK